KPKKIYIELYPDMFYKGNEKLLYNFLIRDYIEISKKYEIKNSDNSFKSQITNHPIYNIFSPSYFQFSIYFLFNSSLFIPNENTIMDFSLYELKKDGSFIPPQSTKDKAGIDFRPFIKKTVLKFKNIEYNIETFEELEKLILIINSLDVNLNIVLSPLHPFIYDLCMENPGFEYILEIEEKIKKICIKHNVTIFGSYNPKDTNAKAEDFYDQVHLKHEKTAKILNF
ncbi:MAG: hypothetical protein M0Q02_09630, partial [Candidatus Muirbacterium halophilum]|nr:hypothetical protein [Candidatus Muirbacterium halophilum]